MIWTVLRYVPKPSVVSVVFCFSLAIVIPAFLVVVFPSPSIGWISRSSSSPLTWEEVERSRAFRNARDVAYSAMQGSGDFIMSVVEDSSVGTNGRKLASNESLLVGLLLRNSSKDTSGENGLVQVVRWGRLLDDGVDDHVFVSLVSPNDNSVWRRMLGETRIRWRSSTPRHHDLSPMLGTIARSFVSVSDLDAVVSSLMANFSICSPFRVWSPRSHLSLSLGSSCERIGTPTIDPFEIRHLRPRVQRSSLFYLVLSVILFVFIVVVVLLMGKLFLGFVIELVLSGFTNLVLLILRKLGDRILSRFIGDMSVTAKDWVRHKAAREPARSSFHFEPEWNTVDGLISSYWKRGTDWCLDDKSKEMEGLLKQHPGVREYLEKNIGSISFSLGSLGKSVDCYTETLVGFAALKHFGLIEQLSLDSRRVWCFLRAVEDRYADTNCYHNRFHAADVVQAVASILSDKELDLLRVLSPFQIFCLIIAAVVHDVDHPGGFVRSPLSRCFDDAPLEQFSLAVMCRILMRDPCNILKTFSEDRQIYFHRMVSKWVLETDLNRHEPFLERLKGWNLRNVGVPTDDDVEIIGATVLKVADVSSSGRPQMLSLEWAGRLLGEFRCARRTLEGPLPDPSAEELRKAVDDQIAFYRGTVIPFYEQAAAVLPPSSLFDVMISNQKDRAIEWEEFKRRARV